MKRLQSCLFYCGIVTLIGMGSILGSAGSAFTARRDPLRKAEGTQANPPILKARRIISTDYRSDDILMELVGPDRILALSPDADNPNLSNIVDRAGRVALRTDANAERILSLEPDLVILGDSVLPDKLTLMRSNGVPVIQMNQTNTVADIQANLRLIGAVVGEPERAEAMVSEMNRKLDDIRRRVQGQPKPRALYVGGGRSYTAGSGTYIDDLLGVAGGLNVAREAGVTNWGSLSIEKAVAFDPEIIFVPDGTEGKSPHSVVQTLVLANDPAWRDVRAVREGRVYLMPRDC
jgi:iron complex transport system substrate-binding protein